jgi:hypothetical protein
MHFDRHMAHAHQRESIQEGVIAHTRNCVNARWPFTLAVYRRGKALLNAELRVLALLQDVLAHCRCS